ncbi:hypothetical protein QBC46DRAFT_56428 [Diplogelasinospora grovesii]|uniref:F-box domain-containing protein n=1 Tax=Diplogelasinospora grovesii TaxID=303347 RepID=A0AAN6N0B4_9PEZI|nr:hypothetical protein QBC46DRAFT_56428 [Diplogelasinospora grovesii]
MDPTARVEPADISTIPGAAPVDRAANTPGGIHELISSRERLSETVRNSIISIKSKRSSTSGSLWRARRGKAPQLEKADAEVIVDGRDGDARKSAVGRSDRDGTKRPLHLLALPAELQLMILARLRFADVERLRRTCKTLRAIADPRQIRTLWGPMQLQMELMGHCKSCLMYDPFRSRLLLSTPLDPGYPLASRCIECALKDDDPRIKIGRKISLANFETVWPCRHCGRPVIEGASYGHEQFHRNCYKAYSDALFGFFILGWIQFSLGVVGLALAVKFFRGAIMVFAPAVTAFLQLWICLFFLIFRGNRVRTYVYTLFFELATVGCWIPPVYYIAMDIAGNPDEPVPTSTQATLAIFALNMFFRLLNAFGNIVLLFEYDMTRAHRPTASTWRKTVHPFAMALIRWTYPQAMEQKYPPDYN